MAKDTKTATDSVLQLDGFAADIFKALGYPEPVPETVAKVYLAFKKHKDRIQPGRLTAEGYAMVCVLADLVDGRFTNPPEGENG